jgi:type II secretory pathway component PulM
MNAAARWYGQRNPRERLLLALGVVIVAVAIVVGVVEPLRRDLAAIDEALVATRHALARAESQREELGRLRPTPTSLPVEPRAAVERVLIQRGLRTAVTALAVKDTRVELTFEAIDFAALTALVDALARDARLFPVEALIAARTAPGSVRAELVLARAPAS